MCVLKKTQKKLKNPKQKAQLRVICLFEGAYWNQQQLLDLAVWLHYWICSLLGLHTQKGYLKSSTLRSGLYL